MAIDANMELVEKNGIIDVFGYMKKLRQSRRGLVETLVNWIEIQRRDGLPII
jgi:hypothetical protein